MKEFKNQPSSPTPQKGTDQLSAVDASHIHLLICGGTIDNIDIDTGARNQTSGIETYLQGYVKPYFGLTRDLLFMKDSREITESDRAALARTIVESSYKRFLVTHGTYTMAETGRYLKRHLDPNQSKLVVLVGSMIPLGEPNSDAPFNLGFASAAAMMLQESGVVIAFNAKIWNPDDVKKNLEDLRFEETE